MPNFIKYLLGLLVALNTHIVIGQNLVLDTLNATFPSAEVLSDEDREQVIKTISGAMNEYAEASKLLDPRRNKITTASAARFKQLFLSTARLMQDYKEDIPGDLVGLNKYVDDALTLLEFSPGGLKVKIESAELKKIADDPGGYWVVTVRIQKLLFNAVTPKNKVIEYPSGRLMTQDITFDIKHGVLDKAFITKISRFCSSPKEPGCGGPADYYISYFGPSAKGFIPSGASRFSTYWNDFHAADSEMRVRGNVSFSLGIDFLTNKINPKTARQKNLFLTAGFHLANYRFTTNLEDFSFVPFEAAAIDANGNDTVYLRVVEPMSPKENIQVTTLELPVGVMYRVSTSRKSDIMIGARLLPSFAIGGRSHVTGEANYGMIFENAHFNSLGARSIKPDRVSRDDGYGPFFIGPRSIDQKVDPVLNTFNLGVQLSPSYYLHLKEGKSGWSLLVAFDLQYQLGSFFQHNPSNLDVLRFQDDYATTFIQQYTESFPVFSYGFRIGLHHKIVSNP